MTHITQRLADALRRRRVYMSAKLHKQFVIPEIDALLSEYDAHPARLYTQAEMDEAVEKERERFPNLVPVIAWLENGCDPKEAAKELRVYQHQIRTPD